MEKEPLIIERAKENPHSSSISISSGPHYLLKELILETL